MVTWCEKSKGQKRFAVSAEPYPFFYPSLKRFRFSLDTNKGQRGKKQKWCLRAQAGRKVEATRFRRHPDIFQSKND